MSPRPAGVVLYGPPASGKSTITTALARVDERFTLLRKLKVGTGRTAEYDLITAERLNELRAAGRIVAETCRYDNVYAIDAAEVERLTAAGRIPVVHMGNLADLHRLTGFSPQWRWLRVLLWITRAECARRSQGRGDADTGRRLRAWDETLADLEHGEGEGGVFDLRITTERLSAQAAAEEIAAAYARLTTSTVRPCSDVATAPGREDAP